MSLLTIILGDKVLFTGTVIDTPKPPDLPPPPPPPPNPLPPAGSGRPIPFARYIIDHPGREGLEWIILHSGWGALSPAEFEAAYAVGYPREPGIQTDTGPSGFPPGFDLTGTERGTGVRNLLQSGQLYAFTWRAPFSGGARWNFEVNPTPGGATASTASWDGARPVQFLESNRIDFQAIAGHMHVITLQLDGRATVATIVRPA